jgi:hypothetical protein
MNFRRFTRQPVLTLVCYSDAARWSLGPAGQVHQAGEVPLPEGLVSDGIVHQPAAVAKLLREDGAFPGSPRHRVVLGIPANRTVLRQLSVPPIDEKRLDELVQREIRRELPMLHENAHVSWTSVARSADRITIFVAGVAKDVLASHVATAHAAGLSPESADLRIVAAARALDVPDAIVAHAEGTELEVAVVRRGVPVIVRTVTSIGGRDAWPSQVAEELTRTIKYYRDSHRADDMPSTALPVAFTGAASADLVIGGIGSMLEQEVSMPQPILHLPDESRAARFSVNAGLAMKELAA